MIRQGVPDIQQRKKARIALAPFGVALKHQHLSILQFV